jgi:energy-coupling factor transport system ATP-binding protein
LITLTNLSYTYPNATRPVLDRLNLHLPAGELTLLMGASGAGKSTLLRCLNGLVPHFSGGQISGQILVNGLNPIEAAPQVMSRHVGFVFQDPEAQFVMDRVEDEIAFALENAAMPPQAMRLRVEEVLDLLDLSALRQRRLDTLSGGEQQRVAIAAVMALRPQLLLLDEPTSQLDPKSAEDVLQSLVRLNHDLGLTIILAEHRLERILPFADQLIYLPPHGAPPLIGAPRDILPQVPLKPPLIALAEALNWQPLPLTIKEGRRFSQKYLSYLGEVLKFPPDVGGIKGGRAGGEVKHGEQSHLTPTLSYVSPYGDKGEGVKYLQAEQLTVHYEQQTILHGVSLSVSLGEIVALMGRNGAGKTTLLKNLVGLMRPQRGRVLVAGRDIASLDVATICQDVGYLPQDPNALLFAETVLEELYITLRNHGWLEDSQKLSTRKFFDPMTLLTRLGLADKADRYPRDLSVGERQRVALAAIMVTQPRALLLDEPTRGLDYEAKHELLTLLQGWRAEGMAILMITHDVELAAMAADRVIVLSQGEIIATGTAAKVLAPSPLFAPQVARLFPETGWLTVADVLGGIRNEK